jgi:hypothetical protein
MCVPGWLGAVYKPLALTVPAVVFPPTTPSTDQVTPVLLVPCTVAVNCVVPFTNTVVEVCDSVTVTPPTVTLALALLVGSATLVAVTVCPPVWAGAVYSPPVLIEPRDAFPPAVPSTDQVTAVLLVPVTVAVNCVAPLGATEGDVGDTVT